MVYFRLMGRPLRLWLALSLAALVAVAACRQEAPEPATPSPAMTPAGETPSAPSPTTAAPTATATATPKPGLTPVATLFQGTRGPVEATPSPRLPAGGAVLVNLRAARHEGFDRIVFEFQGGLPGYHMEYVAPPILGDASGEPIAIAGNAFLRIRFEPAAAHDPNTGTPTYSGPLKLSPGLPSIVEAQETGDFEGVLTWVLGLSQEADFQVYRLQDPFRIAIDIAQP